MHIVEYETPHRRWRRRSIGWAVGCYFVGSVLSATLGTLAALLTRPTVAMADAPPVMVVCPMPPAMALIALLTYVAAAALRRIRGGVFVSRGTSISATTGVLVGWLFVGMMYLPDLPEPLTSLLSLIVVPFASALLIARRLPSAIADRPR